MTLYKLVRSYNTQNSEICYILHSIVTLAVKLQVIQLSISETHITSQVCINKNGTCNLQRLQIFLKRLLFQQSPYNDTD